MLCLCVRDPNVTEDELKDFIQNVRRKEFEEAFLLLDDNSTKKLTEYIQLLKEIKLEEGKYHSYFGEVKAVMNSFLHFYSTVIDDVIREADTYSNVVTKNELIMLIETTINMQQMKQIEFAKIFLPVKTKWEKRIYEELEKEFEVYLKKLNTLREFIYFRLDKQSKIDDFAKEHFKIVVTKVGEIFDTAHLYIGLILAKHVQQTRLSLDDILRRLRNNLAEIKQERDDNVSNLVKQLYEKNKESLTVTRSEARNSIALAEVRRGVDQIKTKINKHQRLIRIERLAKEVEYWTTKFDYFNEIANNIELLKAQQKQVTEDEENYHFLKCKEMAECNKDCMVKLRVAFANRTEEIEKRLVNEMRALVTFYAVRGTDRIFYTDNIGPYYVDEFNHQNYYFDFGLTIYHLNCEGEFIKFADNAYLFDKYGRYIEKDGEKLYQCAPCTSQYKLNEANYLDKVTKDCGHSETVNKRCRLGINDPNNVAVLPDFEPLDIKRTLDTETVKYLWDSFGCVLPEALNDVGKTRPRNPIHFLAHKLLHHKYKRTKSEHEKKKAEAEDYRANIFKERKEKAEVGSKLWKSKQQRRAKPEECDDADHRGYVDAKTAEDLFIMALNNMD